MNPNSVPRSTLPPFDPVAWRRELVLLLERAERAGQRVESVQVTWAIGMTSSSVVELDMRVVSPV